MSDNVLFIATTAIPIIIIILICFIFFYINNNFVHPPYFYYEKSGDTKIANVFIHQGRGHYTCYRFEYKDDKWNLIKDKYDRIVVKVVFIIITIALSFIFIMTENYTLKNLLAMIIILVVLMIFLKLSIISEYSRAQRIFKKLLNEEQSKNPLN